MTFRTALLSCAALIAAAALGFSVIAPVIAQKEPGEAERARIEAIVENYLMENPEIVIRALERYEDRQALLAEAQTQESLVDYLPSLIAAETGHVAGASEEEARVTVIELFDYHCGVCRSAAPMMAEMLNEEDDIRIVFQDLPVQRPESVYAAKAALAVRDQGKYTDMHFAMMAADGVLSAERIAEIARKVGVDVDAMVAGIEADALESELDRVYEMAVDLGVRGTPSFIVASMDGSYSHYIPAWRPEEIVRAVEEAREAAGNGG